MWQAFTAITWNWRTASGLALDATATSNHHDGLFSSSGEERPLTGALRDRLIEYARTGVLPPQPTRITDVIDLGVRAGRHEFALIGSFPDPGDPYSASVICDGADYPATVDVQRADQLTIAIPDPGSGTCPECGCGGVDRCYTDAAGLCRPQGRWCTFHVEHAGSPGSPVLGPRHVCPGPSGSGSPYPQGQDALGQCVAGIGGC